MIFTVGHRDSYERYLREQSQHCYKRGPRGDQPGGSVWQTFEDASRYAKDGFAVYQVDADWEADTVPSVSGGDWRDLVRDARILRIPPPNAVWS